MARLILEVLDGAGGVRSRFRLDALPITIGRGFGNDVILDDPYVNGEHLRIAEDESGVVIAEDRETVNGTFEQVHQPSVKGGGTVRTASARIERVPLRVGQELRVGRTVLRVRGADETVAPPLVGPRENDTREQFLVRITRGWPAVGIGFASLIVCVALAYNSVYTRSNWSRAAGLSFAVMVLLTIWAGLWALAARISRNAAHFRAHFAIACAAALVAMTEAMLESLSTAIAPGSTVAAVVSGVTLTAFLIVLFAAHLAFASGMSARKRWIVAASVTGAIFVVGELADYSRNNQFSTRLEYPGDLLPLDTRLLHSVSVEEFTKSAGALRTELEKEEKK